MTGTNKHSHMTTPSASGGDALAGDQKPSNAAHSVWFNAWTDTGDRKVEAFASSPDAEIVVHQFLLREQKFGDDWVLSHRRSGLSIKQHIIRFGTKEVAVAFAAKLEPLADWSKIKRCGGFGETQGWTSITRKKIGREIVALFEAHETTSTEPGSPVLTPSETKGELSQ